MLVSDSIHHRTVFPIYSIAMWRIEREYHGWSTRPGSRFSRERLFSGIVLDVGSLALVYLCSPQAYFASGFIYEESATLQGETVTLPTKAKTMVTDGRKAVMEDWAWNNRKPSRQFSEISILL